MRVCVRVYRIHNRSSMLPASNTKIYNSSIRLVFADNKHRHIGRTKAERCDYSQNGRGGKRQVDGFSYVGQYSFVIMDVQAVAE